MTDTQELVPTTIAPPDLSKVERAINWESLKVTVTDPTSCELAATGVRVAKDYIGEVTRLFSEPKGAAHKLHKWFTTLEKKFLDPANSVLAHNTAQVQAHLKRVERERDELERNLQRAATEQAAKAAAEAMPWETPPEPPEIVVLAPAATPANIGVRRKPFGYRVDDLLRLVRAIAADPSLIEAIQINDSFMKSEARQCGESLSAKYPGITAVRDVSLRW